MSIPNCGFVYNKYYLVNKHQIALTFLTTATNKFKESLEIHFIDV